MFEYFYNEIFRSVIIGFGSLFNGIEIKQKDSSQDVFSVIKVPLAYGPTQKFLARLEQERDLNKPVQITLPRMSFEFTDLQYDPSRKATQTQAFYVIDDNGEKVKKVFMPVPYNMTIELAIMTKLNDDMLQIVEQILPYFQPSYTLPIKFLGELKEVQNVPVQLESISMEDDYEGNFDTRRCCMVLYLMLLVMSLRKSRLVISLEQKQLHQEQHIQEMSVTRLNQEQLKTMMSHY